LINFIGDDVMMNYRKSKNVFKIAFFLLVLFSAKLLYAQESSFTFLHFTNESGLPSSYVKSIAQDQQGFIWLATRISVSRFDGTNYKTFPAFDALGESVEIFSNKVFLFADSLLVTRTNNGVYFYFDSKKECFYPYNLLNNLGVIQEIAPAENGFWICQSNEIYFVNASTQEKLTFNEICLTFKLPLTTKISDIVLRDKQLVAFANGNQLLKFDFQANTLSKFDLQTKLDNATLDVNYIDWQNQVWVEDESNGMARIHMETGQISYFSTSEKYPNYLPHNMVHCFGTDKQQRIWIGTEAGLVVYDPATNHSEVCRYDILNPKGLNTDPIYDTFCDRDGNIWLGTYFGGINFWRAEESFFRTWEAGSGKWQLGGNVVSCFTSDKQGNLWIGLEDMGLNYLDMKTGEVKKYVSQKGVNSLSYNNLHDLLFVSDNELWIASYTGGINVLDIKGGLFTHFKRENTPQLNSNAVYKLQRIDHEIYIATSLGINVYNLKTGQFSKFKHDVLGTMQFESITKTQNKVWFSTASGVYVYDRERDEVEFLDRIPEFTNINFVKADSKNNIWIGDCYDGIACYDITKDTVTVFNRKNGFPASWIFSIEEGGEGWYWASSDKGLIKFHPKLGLNILYDSNSGIPFNQFNYRASFTDSEGNVYFGGNNGMVSFNESHSPMLIKPTNVVLTGLQLFNKPVSPQNSNLFKESISVLKKLVLNYDQNVFTIEYSALAYSLQGRCQYAYYLEGFENDWNYVGNREFATYTNLSPGRYVFHVKGSTNNIMNETNQRTLEIRVRPPFWFSYWAFLIYFFIVWLFSVQLYRFGKYLEKNRAMAEMERLDKVHAEEIHNVKLEFFTNISHELKTPLTLILGPLNRIIEEEKLSPASQKRLFGIEKNARRLFTLIDQLLEFRKIERGKEKLEVEEVSIRAFGIDIAKAFENIVEANDIEFITHFPPDESTAWFDPGKVDKIIFNLLSNAFKYTPAGGMIGFKIQLIKTGTKKRSQTSTLEIEISDTGKGIKPDMLDKVFERFFQTETNKPNMHSSGIGLAYVKSLVMLHCGEIHVKSELDRGTTFVVNIPVSKNDYSENDLCNKMVQFTPNENREILITDKTITLKEIQTAGLTNKPTVLIVEDNVELSDFIVDILEPNFTIIKAYNGLQALSKMDKLLPDLIIADVMMPEMDGFELTKQLKTDIKTSHIPVILLTAKSGIENRLLGLNTGADFYIEKPFIPEILIKNIENIINTRKRLIERFKNDAYIQVDDVAFSESDKEFIEKLTQIIKDNISTEFDVDFLVKQLRLSRTLIHMKLKSLVNCSTTEFIRSIRVKEAIKLIAEGKCNISEAAYRVGFSSPTYFTRRFKEMYGKSPSEYFNKFS
jgi:signal transduction histidine kinase/ligand-binding sensor domain-containing protein/DNA-binding response OmpR family regulator